MTLPVVFRQLDDLDKMVNILIEEYRKTYYETPNIERTNSWISSLRFLLSSNISIPVIVEYPIFNEVADFIFLDKSIGIVAEAKGWHNIKKINDYVVDADGKIKQDPCFQLENYVSKLNYFHPQKIKFRGILILYNTNQYSTSSDCVIIRKPEELKREVDSLEPPSEDDIDKFKSARLTITKDLLSLLKDLDVNQILSSFSQALYASGYGLVEDQVLVVEDVLHALESKNDKVILIRGGSGSGKTLVALTLFFEGLKRGYNVVLSYKNNRLINTLKYILERNKATKPLTEYIRFYSTGRVRPAGIGDDNYEETHDLAIFDEAQRMTKKIIGNTMKRARVKVYFYDEEQILVGDEEGTEKNFINLANENVEKRTLTGAFRMPYADLIRKLLKGDNVTLPSSFFKVHDHIDKMLDSIRNKNGKKALICAFTESEGDKDNVNSPKNIRIGYPLQSSFDLYKNKNLKITWLMNEKTEYPKYWSGEFKDPLSRCSSVYGAQGFEADYVGVVWGRDLVWRGKWVVNTSPITDNVGGKQYSLKVIAKKNVQKALELLRNRYYIMLTRGIREVHIFAEDDMTREYLKSITRSP